MKKYSHEHDAKLQCNVLMHKSFKTFSHFLCVFLIYVKGLVVGICRLYSPLVLSNKKPVPTAVITGFLYIPPKRMLVIYCSI